MGPNDGGSGMRHRDEPLTPGDALSEGGVDYVVERASSEMSFRHPNLPRRTLSVTLVRVS
jgi:hypothetical protein